MKPENEDVRNRIISLLAQLQSESAILDKIVYKAKNQHRRAFYFQYLLKVRRDLKLLASANLKEMLNFLFQIGKEEKSSIRAKRRKTDIGKHQCQLRLLGVARLLSQMVEPIVKAAIEFSSLLARSFFMSFSLTILALLARLRVLVQQILLDVVSVFNMFSSSLQGCQSTVLSFGGVGVVREYHPSDNEVIELECVWETDKFVLLEKTNKSETNNQVKHAGGGVETPLRSSNPLVSSNIKYQTIEAFLGDDELGCQEDPEHTKEELSGLRNEKSHESEAYANQQIKLNNEMEIGGDGDDNDGQGLEGSHGEDLAESDIISSTKLVPCQKLQTVSRRNVAFLPVGRSTPQKVTEDISVKKEVEVDSPANALDEKENSLFSLLAAGYSKESLF